MSHTPLEKAYDPAQVESKWYNFWQEQGFFSADTHSPKPAYCIVIPPPNVTGVLHMGHALVNTLQDILIRWKRMSGFEALWLPGLDHAGISTQTVVERHLIATQGKRRKDFPREEFLSHVWKWKEENGTRILNQLKRMGCSCDWSRQRFTMDEGNNRAVRTMFKKMYDAGLIYRGDYLVNWDPVTQTALADDEVEYEERNGFLYHIRYPYSDGSGHAIIATTRPETMFGDTAVAVSPTDKRYHHLIGKTILLPFLNRPLPIVAHHHIEAEFGTGMVKVTPAHDPNDYQIGLDLQLPFINILTPDGRLNENGGPFAGMPYEEARTAVVRDLQAQGLIEKIVPHTHRVGISYRSKATIQPYLSKQWYIKMGQFATKLHAAVTEKQVALIPSSWENTYFHWIDNLRDWCISRQLWWGHRIPIWYHVDDPSKTLCYDGVGDPPEVQAAPDQWRQDEDVLDTWFSSALWPFATLGWPEQTPDLQKFYPNSVLVTGHDILFFWVARMILMGEFAMGVVPFPETFLHGLIYGKSYWRELAGGGIRYVDESERLEYELGKPTPKDVLSKWEKMSKSKGNVIDPLELIDSYGTDAVRMALCASATQARQIDLDRRRFEEFKNFANKIWNGARFVFMNLDGDEKNGPLTAEQLGLDLSLLALEDRWILTRLNHVVEKVAGYLTRYEFDRYALEAYDFFWKEFCAYYVEIVKPILFGKIGTSQERTQKQQILAIVLCTALRLLHPVAPFITEELFQALKNRFPELPSQERFTDPYTRDFVAALSSPACITAPFPQPIELSGTEGNIEATFSLLEEIVYTIRNVRGEMKLAPSQATDLYIVVNQDVATLETLKKGQHVITALTPVKQLSITTEIPTLPFAGTGAVGTLKIILPLPAELREKERVRLEKELEKLNLAAQKLKEQLDNGEFIAKAPTALVDKLRLQQSQTESQLQTIKEKLHAF